MATHFFFYFISLFPLLSFTYVENLQHGDSLLAVLSFPPQKTLSPQTVSQAVRAQRTVQGTALTVQELTTAVNQAQAQAQARANLTSGTATVVTTTSLTAAQLAAQRTVAAATSVTGGKICEVTIEDAWFSCRG